jgi:L-fucose isomerase-like protein
MRERTLGALAAIKGVEVVVPTDEVTPQGLVQNDDQALATIKYFEEAQVDGVVLGSMDFADEVSSATVAAAIGKPTLLFATKEGELRPDGERASDSFCGSLSIGVALHRRKVPFVFGGLVWPEEDKFRKEAVAFVRACAAVRAFRGARIGQIGVRPERFETVAYDEPLLLSRFGQKVIPIEVNDLTQAARSIPEDDPEVVRLAAEIAGEATVLNVGPRSLTAMAQYELAVTRWARERRLSAVAQMCWGLARLMGVAACSTLGRLTEKGLLASCETDVLGALDMIVQHNVALKETVPHFIDWTVQHRTRENVFLAWHCGNAPTCLRAQNSEVILRNRRRPLDVPIPEDDSGAGVWEMTLRPGPVTITRLVEYDGVYKMLITKGEIVEDPAKERGSGSWVEVSDLEKLYATLFEEGFIHHASMVHGDVTKALGEFCKFVGIKTIVV